MKLIDDTGTEHEITGRTQAYELVKKLTADKRFGPKRGHHVERTPSGYFRFKVVSHGKVTFGETRLTFDEAAEDYRQVLAGAAPAAGVPARGSEEWRRKHREGRARAYAAALAASPDGKVHLKPSTCSACQQVGHKANACPASGWVKKVYQRASRAGAPCRFCRQPGHRAKRCPARRDRLAAAMARRWAA